jgi:putative membrane protein
MKTAMWASALMLVAGLANAASPDEKFVKEAAEGGLSEVELGRLAQQKAASPAVKEFGALMVKDHSAANEKLKGVAGAKQVSVPKSPSVMQKAMKAKLEILSGDTFDKSYVQGMIKDHKDDIKKFEDEASQGKDPEVKAFASATLPTLRTHLEKIQSIAAAAGIKE